MKDKEKIREYWNERAKTDKSEQSTTNDYYLREIEFKVLLNILENYKPNFVLDIGCGDGRTTLKLALKFPQTSFYGYDYSEAMIINANENKKNSKINNVTFSMYDITDLVNINKFDIIYSTRCLINIPSWTLQKKVIEWIAKSLNENGLYIMIENFLETHQNFNSIRRDYDLPDIPIRDHNLFFERNKLLSFLDPLFEIINEVNISSSYYLVSRIIYSKICQDKGVKPDYSHPCHKYASNLPFLGEYGPIRMLILKRR